MTTGKYKRIEVSVRVSKNHKKVAGNFKNYVKSSSVFNRGTITERSHDDKNMRMNKMFSCLTYPEVWPISGCFFFRHREFAHSLLVQKSVAETTEGTFQLMFNALKPKKVSAMWKKLQYLSLSNLCKSETLALLEMFAKVFACICQSLRTFCKTIVFALHLIS